MQLFSITRLYLLLTLTASALLGGCGEAERPAPVANEATRGTLSNELTTLEKRTEAGDAEARRLLGEKYLDGQDVPKDIHKGLELIRQASDQGDSDALYIYGGYLCSIGKSNTDSISAFSKLEEAASLGHPRASLFLGLSYLGNWVQIKEFKCGPAPMNSVKGISYLERAAALGDVEAHNFIAEAYSNGKSVARDLDKAIEWWKKGADLGSASAQHHLGYAYSTGKGVHKNPTKSVEWYKKAAEQGYSRSQNNLCGAYFLGEGVPKDLERAFYWCRQSAEQGEESAQAYLAWAYWTGEGVSKDEVLGYSWSNLAASKNSVVSSIREEYERKLSPSEKAEGQRLSSNWKNGQTLVREGKTVDAVSSVGSGALSKRRTGTIFVVSRNGHAITNWHVASNCSELRVQGRNELAKLLTTDKVNDLALMQLQSPVTDTATIAAEPGNLRQGEEIVAFGFPLNSVLASGGNLTPGVVSALTGFGNNTNQIQITAPIQPGSSGSPLLNRAGEVVGVVSMKLDEIKMAKAIGHVGQNINFAVSGQTLKSFLDAHRVNYNVGRSFFALGKSTADLADEARKWTMVVECWN